MPTALFWALLFFTSNLYANPKYTFESIPNPTLQNLYISNPDNILNENDTLFIDQTLKSIEQKTSHEIAVVIVKDIESSDTKDFAVRLFNHWGIGKKGKDNGLLILLITEKRRVEIEVGYGLEGIITDLNANRVIQNSMIPSLKEAQYSEAIRKALNDIETLFNHSDDALLDNSNDKIFDHPLNQLGFGELVQSSGKYNPFFYFLSVFGLVFSFIALIFIKNIFRTILAFKVADKKKRKQIGISILFPAVFMIGFLTLEIYFFILIFYMIINFIFYYYSEKKYYSKTMDYVSNKTNQFPFNLFLSILFLLVSIYVFSLRTYRKYKIVKMKKAGFQHVAEETENSFLTPSQVTEEKIGAAEYDVFVDSKSQKIQIEKTSLVFGKYSNCTKCQTQALYAEKDIVTKEATNISDGSGIKHMHCSHCDDRFKESYTISATSSNSSSSSSGGGSTFGGGRSGGGGAGGSW